MIYALKEITAGDQFEIEIYPQFRSMDEVPPEGRTIKKDNNKAQKNLNDKNARKYVERLINENFSDRDIWMTLTYDDAHLPPDGDVDAAIKNVQKYIRRINYQRKKRGLPNAKYVYVTAYNPDAEIRWHHHIVMDGALDMETVESCWKQSSRNEVRRLQTDENGLSGMANYIVEEKNRVPSEKRWNSSQGLRDPRIKVVHSKRPAAGGSYKKIGSFVDGMVKDRDSIPEILKKWYPDMDFTNANVYYNDFNCMKEAKAAGQQVSESDTEENGMNPPEARAGDDYETPHPEGITSLCYSCTEYETCNVKTGTCTSCDQYKNRAEAYKTDEQRYSEEQDAIDREAKKKLREMEQEEKMQNLPSDTQETGQKVHQIRLAKSYFDDVANGIKTFELRKNDRGYKKGDILEMMEFADGKNTGRMVKVLVTYILEDYTGIEDGYCIMATKLMKDGEV